MKTPRHGCSGGSVSRRTGTLTIIAAIGLLVCLVLPAHATPYYVNESIGNNNYDGLSDTVGDGHGPKLNTSAAISLAPDGSTIQLDTGDYAETLWDSGANSLTLNPAESVFVCGADLCGTDTVGDNIPDWCRLQFFGTPMTTNADSCAGCDKDGDGFSNLQEFLAGTDPTDFNSQSPNNLHGAECFTNRYGILGTNLITIAPWTSQGIFYQGDTVTISNSLGTTIEVYDFHFNSIANAAPPLTLTGLPMGHYFVQVNGANSGFGDRVQFSVWPTGYTNHPRADIGELPAWTPIQSNRYVRLSPGFSRIQAWWGQSTPNQSGQHNAGIVTHAGTHDWTIFDQFVSNYPDGYESQGSYQGYAFGNAPVKVINIICSHTNDLSLPEDQQWQAPAVDKTNSLSSWINDVATIYAEAAQRYSNSVIYEILNEPSGANIDFRAPLNEDPYWDTDPCVLPAAMAVSATVQAVKLACPTCTNWGPASLGFSGWCSRTTTDAFAIPYYSSLDVLSFHDVCGWYGQVDNTFNYTNRPDIFQFMATDLSDELMANLYPGKSFVITECYPHSPDVLGKTNTWWDSRIAGAGPAPTDVPNWAWNWHTMTMRFWKDLIEAKATKVVGAQIFLSLADADQVGGSSYAGWDGPSCNDQQGCGPAPSVDGQAMISWWLENATPLTNWLSGSRLLIADPLGGYTNGVPGLHFWEWQFANGSTNTFVWADEEITVTTNFGVGITDIFSNQWTGPIGIEPVIAWGWGGP